MTGPLYLIRHPAPEVPPGVCYGRTDLPCRSGEIETLAPLLSPQLPQAVLLYSSPLQRCLALARRLPATRVVIDERLAELDFGSWEMRSWEHIARQEIDAWAADVAAYRPGGADSVLAMARRVAAFHDALPEGPAIIVSHAGTMRLLAARHQGLDIDAMAGHAAAEAHRIAYGELLVLPRV